MEYFHFIIQQYQLNNNEQLEYQPEQSPLIAKLIGDIQFNMITKGASLAQQYMLYKGVKLFGSKGRMAIIIELTQLCKRNCFTPVAIKDMTRV